MPPVIELLKGVPTRMDLTDGDGNERTALQEAILPDRVYVMDRGYAKFVLFADILRAKSSFVCRVRDNSLYEILEDRTSSCADTAVKAGEIQSDLTVRFTGDQATKAGLDRPLRLVKIVCHPHRCTHKNGRGGSDQGEVLLVATDIMDVEPEVIALIYKNRWAIETFFRFFKHILGCRHLLSHCQNGIEIQTYVAIIACLLIALWTGRKATLRTYEMLCFYMSGLADEEELLAHIEKLQPQD
jgi:IS4 transposase